MMASQDRILAVDRPKRDELDLQIWFEVSPVPTLVISPARIIQKASRALLKAWDRREETLIGSDLFTSLYRDSPTERFDRIPLAHALEQAATSRASQLCHAAYVSPLGSWSARILPLVRDDELRWFVLEWEQTQPPAPAGDGSGRNEDATGGDWIHAWLPMDEAFRILIQTVKDYAIFLLDTRGNVATWNAGAELLKGYRRDEIVGQHFSRFYGPEDLRARKPERELEVCLREGRVEDEGWRYRQDGTRFWASVVITAVYKDGVHVGFGKVTRDLTERREAELRLVAAYEESARLKNEFLANMSHEIRTPMHGMLTACSLLLDTPLSEEQREITNIIDESGNVLLRVINDILDYSKLTSGSFSIKPEPVDVAGIVTSVTRSVQLTLQPGVQCELVVDSNVPSSMLGDPLRFRQVVQNIVTNAAKFTEAGSITIHTSVTKESEEGYTVMTEVADTGIGVSDEASQSLFKPFVQLDSTTKKRHQGTGLGLSIAKSLVELMGGRIEYRRNPAGQGSVFCFSVKFAKAPTVSQGPANTQSLDLVQRTTSTPSVQVQDNEELIRRLQNVAPNIHILAAEDNLINQKMIIGVLHKFGFHNVAIAPDGAQAVAMVASNPQLYDLILMDVSMPVMDGYEATARIKQIFQGDGGESGRHAPIVAMTAHALKGDNERCLERGMDDYVTKPIRRKLLLQILLKWLVPVDEPGGIQPALETSTA